MFHFTGDLLDFCSCALQHCCAELCLCLIHVQEELSLPDMPTLGSHRARQRWKIEGEEVQSNVVEDEKKNDCYKTESERTFHREGEMQARDFCPSSLPSFVQRESQKGRDTELPLWKYSMFLLSICFSVVMAAVSEVSLCQVPVGLTPVFEADEHRGV